jgi:hypothetical protein
MSAVSMSAALRTAAAFAAVTLLSAVPLVAAADEDSPLVEKVRAATVRYLNINVALREGWTVATPCVSGPDTGAMGVHLVLGSRLSPAALNAEQPQALIYEPMANGAMRLVGVEFIQLEQDWASAHTMGTPSLEGNLLNYISFPNRYGLPAFYEMHVWAFERNPKGSFADWNTHVTCEHQAAP